MLVVVYGQRSCLNHENFIVYFLFFNKNTEQGHKTVTIQSKGMFKQSYRNILIESQCLIFWAILSAVPSAKRALWSQSYAQIFNFVQNKRLCFIF